MVDDALINSRATIDLRLWFCVVYFSALTESLRLPLSLAPTFFYRLRWSTISLINHHHQRYSHSKRHRLSIDSIYWRFAYSITRFNIKKVSRQSSYGNFFSIMDVWKLRHATVRLENNFYIIMTGKSFFRKSPVIRLDNDLQQSTYYHQTAYDATSKSIPTSLASPWHLTVGAWTNRMCLRTTKHSQQKHFALLCFTWRNLLSNAFFVYFRKKRIHLEWDNKVVYN